jgi:hypothetical protein
MDEAHTFYVNDIRELQQKIRKFRRDITSKKLRIYEIKDHVKVFKNEHKTSSLLRDLQREERELELEIQSMNQRKIESDREYEARKLDWRNRIQALIDQKKEARNVRSETEPWIKTNLFEHKKKVFKFFKKAKKCEGLKEKLEKVKELKELFETLITKEKEKKKN